MSLYTSLITAEDTALLLIDDQPQMLMGPIIRFSAMDTPMVTMPGIGRRRVLQTTIRRFSAMTQWRQTS